MRLGNLLHKGTKLSLGLIVITNLILAGCGGGGGASATNSSAINPLTPAQITAITVTQISAYSDADVAALGVNIKYLSDAALQALTFGTNAAHPIGQIESISAAQIAALTPAQVRMIGAAGPGGSVATSQIQYLNTTAWAALVSDPLQVAAITPAEIATIWDSEIVAMGTNIKYLSNVALNALTPWTTSGPHSIGQVESITVTQIAALTPAQVRMIGAAGPGGSVATSQIRYLNSGAWAVLANDPLQVVAITAAETATLTGVEISSLGINIQYLPNASMGAMTITTCSATCASQLESITVVQIAALSPAQIGVIAGINAGTGIAYLNIGAFGALSATQVAVLTPANVTLVSAAQLASLSTVAIAGFAPTTIASLTLAQKVLLSVAQHTACGC